MEMHQVKCVVILDIEASNEYQAEQYAVDILNDGYEWKNRDVLSLSKMERMELQNKKAE